MTRAVQIKFGCLSNLIGAVRPKTYERIDANNFKIEEQIINGFERRIAEFKCFGIKNDQKGNHVDSKGTMRLPCDCVSMTNHNDHNHACVVALTKRH